MTTNYKDKYIKYKTKYNNLKIQNGGKTFVHTEEDGEESKKYVYDTYYEKKIVTKDDGTNINKHILTSNIYECGNTQIKFDENNKGTPYSLLTCKDESNPCELDGEEKHSYTICDSKISVAKAFAKPKSYFEGLDKFLVNKYVSMLSSESYQIFRDIIKLNETEYVKHMNDIITSKIDNHGSNKDDSHIKQKTDGINKFYLEVFNLKLHTPITYEHTVIKGTTTDTTSKTKMHNEIEQIIKIINNKDRKYIKYDRSIDKSELYKWFYDNIINSMRKNQNLELKKIVIDSKHVNNMYNMFKKYKVPPPPPISKEKKASDPKIHEEYMKNIKKNFKNFIEEHKDINILKNKIIFKEILNLYCRDNNLLTNNNTTELPESEMKNKKIVLFNLLSYSELFIVRNSIDEYITDINKITNIDQIDMTGKYIYMDKILVHLLEFDSHMTDLRNILDLMKKFIVKYVDVNIDDL